MSPDIKKFFIILGMLKFFNFKVFFKYLTNNFDSLNWSSYASKILKVSTRINFITFGCEKIIDPKNLKTFHVFQLIIHWKYFSPSQTLIVFVLLLHFVVCLELFILKNFSRDTEKKLTNIFSTYSTLIDNSLLWGNTTDGKFAQQVVYFLIRARPLSLFRKF